MENAKKEWQRSLRYEKNVVAEEDIQEIISSITGIPLSRIVETESEKLLRIENQLHERIIGQHDAITAIAAAIRRSRTGLSSPKRPLGSFIFLGPTGVGKTELAKTLTEFLFGNQDSLVRLDMSDFMEKHTVSRLVGAPPGYVGYEEGGLLTEKIRRRPYSVVLLDEIEKAHPDVFNILLQVLEEGELQDNLGHRVSFRNTVLIMTSNAGAREISRDSALGFRSDGGLMTYGEIRTSAMGELKRMFRPEFLNRVDEIVVFHSLDRKEVMQILGIMIDEVRLRLLEINVTIDVKKSAKEFLIDRGFDAKFGARPLRRAIQRELEDPLSMRILKGKCPTGSEVLVSARKGKLIFQIKKPTKKEEPAGVTS